VGSSARHAYSQRAIADFFGSAGTPMNALLKVKVEIPKSPSRILRNSSSTRWCRVECALRALNGSPAGPSLCYKIIVSYFG
jgi:hypothetical protein